MAMTIYLLDKSAAGSRLGPAAELRRDQLTISGQLAMTHMVALELLYSARSYQHYQQIQDSLQGFRWVPTSETAMRRALEIQALLAARGQHRQPLPDLIIAAVAEVEGLTILHYDQDFDLIAEVTGQPAEWIVPRGTLDTGILRAEALAERKEPDVHS